MTLAWPQGSKVIGRRCRHWDLRGYCTMAYRLHQQHQVSPPCKSLHKNKNFLLQHAFLEMLSYMINRSYRCGCHWYIAFRWASLSTATQNACFSSQQFPVLFGIAYGYIQLYGYIAHWTVLFASNWSTVKHRAMWCPSPADEYIIQSSLF